MQLIMSKTFLEAFLDYNFKIIFMKKINLFETGVRELTLIEAVAIEGGHDGAAYKAGKVVHHLILGIAEVAKGIFIGLLTR